MKTSNNNIKWFAAALVLVLASCSKNDAEISLPAKKAAASSELISFNVVAGTKAVEEKTTDTHAAVAYYLPEGYSFPNDVDYATLYMNEQAISYNMVNDNHTTSSNYFWPEDGGSLTIFSYSPYEQLKDIVKINPNVINGVTIPEVYDINEHQDIHFMIADPMINKTCNDADNGITATYRSAICEIGSINIALQENHSTEVYKLQSVSLSGHYTQGTYSNGWTLCGEACESTVLFDGEEKVIDADGIEAMNIANDSYLMLPQVVKTGKMFLNVVYTITTGQTVQTIKMNVDLRDYLKEFKAGNKYSFDLTIEQTGVISMSPGMA